MKTERLEVRIFTGKDAEGNRIEEKKTLTFDIENLTDFQHNEIYKKLTAHNFQTFKEERNMETFEKTWVPDSFDGSAQVIARDDAIIQVCKILWGLEEGFDLNTLARGELRKLMKVVEKHDPLGFAADFKAQQRQLKEEKKRYLELTKIVMQAKKDEIELREKEEKKKESKELLN